MSIKDKTKAWLKKKVSSKSFKKNLRHDIEIIAVLAIFLIFAKKTGKAPFADEVSAVSGQTPTYTEPGVDPVPLIPGVETDTSNPGTEAQPQQSEPAKPQKPEEQTKTEEQLRDEFLEQYGPDDDRLRSIEQELKYLEDLNKEDPYGTAVFSDIPPYSGETYVVLNDNVPKFNNMNLPEGSKFESTVYYSNLDILGRCDTCYGILGYDLMPTEERGDISDIYPTGWEQEKYDFVESKWLYNRCHIIGYQLTGENDNPKNLITGTRSFNVDGMLPFENIVASYIRRTKNHVFYRVTPIYNSMDMLAYGVQMEAYSVEDHGEGVEYNVFVYNVQDGVVIDYTTGKNHAE